jgi:hypothetical protein
MKKPTKNRLPKPPRHLRLATRRWWATVVADFELEPHHLMLLTKAAEAFDRAEQAREILAKEGLTYEDRFDQPRARPEVGIERDSRLGFARLLRELALDANEPDDIRPPRLAGTGS